MHKKLFTIIFLLIFFHGAIATNDVLFLRGTGEPETPADEPASDAQEFSGECTILCSSNSTCNDGLETTTDTCVNPGACDSYCSNEQCSIVCATSSSCDDGNPLTSDVCANPNTCEASCQSASCNPVCITNSECDDENPETTDICTGQGRCTATCSNPLSSTIGDGICGSGETKCNSPQDCGTCSESINEIYEYACIGNSCKQTIKLGVCGNNRCENNENFFTCQEDCKPENIVIGSSLPDPFYIRGETVHVAAELTVEGEEYKAAKVRASGFFGGIPLYNNGQSGDGTRNDNIYANYFVIGTDSDEGLYPITITAEIAGTESKKIVFLNLVPKITLSTSLSKPFFILGDNLVVKTRVMKKNWPLNLPVDVNFYFENELLKSETIIPVNGEFTAAYRTTLIDNDGNYLLVMATADENNNFGFAEIKIPVLNPDATNFLYVEPISPDKNAFEKGSEATISAIVKGIDNKFVENARVIAKTSFGKEFSLFQEGSIYTGAIQIPRDIKTGSFTVRIDATRANKQGSAEITLEAIDSGVELTLLEPETSYFLSGEELLVKVNATYSDNSPFTAEKIFGSLGNEPFELKAVSPGIFEARPIYMSEEKGKIELKITADDSYSEPKIITKGLEVTGVSYMYYVRRYAPSILLFAIAFVLTLFFGYSYLKRLTGIDAMKKKEQRIISQIKGIQTQYFVEASIDKRTYDKYMEKYDAELQDVRESIRQQTLKGKK